MQRASGPEQGREQGDSQDDRSVGVRDLEAACRISLLRDGRDHLGDHWRALYRRLGRGRDFRFDCDDNDDDDNDDDSDDYDTTTSLLLWYFSSAAAAALMSG